MATLLEGRRSRPTIKRDPEVCNVEPVTLAELRAYLAGTGLLDDGPRWTLDLEAQPWTLNVEAQQ
jgi:hypothetical protein